MTDTERRSKCIYYDQVSNPLGCANRCPCPFGKLRVVDGKRMCRENGDIGGIKPHTYREHGGEVER